MGKHKKAHRTYPDGGKQNKKGKAPHDQNAVENAMVGRQETKPHRLVTAESVRAGHPDKICDQIADAILDAHLRQDKNARVAVEVMATDGKIVIAGEISSVAQVNYHKIVYEQLSRIGCGYGDLTSNRAVPFEIDIRIHEQSPDINGAVNHESVYDVGGVVSLADALGAGDQGIMVGYATNETGEMLPLPVVLAHNICETLDAAMADEAWLCADGKAQVTVMYRGDTPVSVTDIVVSAQHLPGKDRQQIEDFIMSDILPKVIPERYWSDKTRVHINPSGRFVKGGPVADTGLTGRKLAVDAYGPVAHLGGGAMSGKDPTKVDRTGAYAARWVAKNIVAAGLASRCEVQIAYAIGMTEPISVSVETFGTGKVPTEVLARAVRTVFDLRPGALIERLNLRETRYAPLAVYGHFGRGEMLYAWERVDRVEELLAAVKES